MSNVSDMAKEIAGIVEQADEIAEVVRGVVEISKSLHGKFPVPEVAEELRVLFGTELKPLWTLLVDAAAHSQTSGAMFRAKLVRKIMDEHQLSESCALAIVLNEQEAFRKAINSIKINDTEKDSKK